MMQPIAVKPKQKSTAIQGKNIKVEEAPRGRKTTAMPLLLAILHRLTTLQSTAGMSMDHGLSATRESVIGLRVRLLYSCAGLGLEFESYES